MQRLLSVFSVATLLVLGTAGPASADDGCARALAATAGTPGQAFVAAHCVSQSTTPTTPAVRPAAGAVAAENGCAIAELMTRGTNGHPWVVANCGQSLDNGASGVRSAVSGCE